MIPFVRRGEYEVTVNGSRVGFMRSAQKQMWFLGSQFVGGAPTTFTVRRMGNITSKSVWKNMVQSGGVAFGIGWILERRGPVPPRLKPGGGLGGLASVRGGGGSLLQIDPGVVLIWRGGSVRGAVPDVGIGLAFDAGSTRNEVFVPYQGQSNNTQITVKHAHRTTDRDAAEQQFRQVAQNQNLDWSSGARFDARRFTSAPSFWSVI
ncbi:MAG TPA: hypothetical protein DFR83_29475 [Deltaproteobacteria bacterium]|nr:hypothetical protein [Deltaproteobacteria bacterium]